MFYSSLPRLHNVLKFKVTVYQFIWRLNANFHKMQKVGTCFVDVHVAINCRGSRNRNGETNGGVSENLIFSIFLDLAPTIATCV